MQNNPAVISEDSGMRLDELHTVNEEASSEVWISKLKGRTEFGGGADIAAASVMLGRPIIVWAWDKDEPERFDPVGAQHVGNPIFILHHHSADGEGNCVPHFDALTIRYRRKVLINQVGRERKQGRDVYADA